MVQPAAENSMKTPGGISARASLIIIPILAIWFGLITFLATRGSFRAPADLPPIALLAAAVIPAIVFYGAYRTFPALRSWVHQLDLALVTATQAWRVIGVSFLFLWGLGDLPAVFAAPAGFGDLAVGLVAAFVTLQVARRTPNWKRSSYLLILFGMLDFVAAFGTAILSDASRPLALPGAPDSTLMQQFPMALIPAFAVPAFIILHLVAWLKLRNEP